MILRGQVGLFLILGQLDVMTALNKPLAESFYEAQECSRAITFKKPVSKPYFVAWPQILSQRGHSPSPIPKARRSPKKLRLFQLY